MSAAYQREFTSRVQQSRTLHVALAFVTALQGISMFFGLHELLPPGSVEGIVIPIAAGVVITVVFWLVWNWLLHTVPLSADPAKRLLGVLLGVVLTAISIGTTSWFIASSLGGARAVQTHMQAFLGDASRQLGVLNANANAEQGLTGTVSSISTAWRGLATDEEKLGTVSGTKGAGPRTAMLRRAAASFEVLQASINGRFAEFETARGQADQLLADMSKIANVGKVATAQIKFAEDAARLYQLFASMERMSALPLVEQAGIVNYGETAGEVIVTDTALTKKLHDAARKLKADRKPVVLAVYQPTNGANATLDYASSVPGAWMVGVAFDLLPLIMMLGLLLGHSEARVPYESHRAFTVVGGREAA